jgi:Tfp pilus assembly protein PilF
MAHVREELRGIQQFGWLAWSQAAQYWLTHGGSLDEAQQLADKSIALRETYPNLTTRAAIAEKKGDAKLASELKQKALTVASEADLNQQGYKLLGEKKYDEAIELFKKNVADHPQSWNAFDSLAEAYQTKGDKKSAAENYSKALSLVKDESNHKRIEQTLLRLKNK